MFTKLKFLLCLAFAAALTGCDKLPGFSPSSVSVAAVDIAGVTIGTPLASQKSLIANVNPNYQLKDFSSMNSRQLGIETLGIEAVQNDNELGRPLDELIVLQNSNELVWYIERSQKFKKGAEIHHKTLMDALKEKYGSPTLSKFSDKLGSKEFSQFTMMWMFNQQGTLLTQNSLEEATKNRIEPCPCVVIDVTMNNDEGIVSEIDLVDENGKPIDNRLAAKKDENGRPIDENGNPVDKNDVLDIFAEHGLVSRFVVAIYDGMLSQNDAVAQEGYRKVDQRHRALRGERNAIDEQRLEQGAEQLIELLKR
ncbi:MAG: hypothetical protein LBU53_08395 [Zoogloeaceae bacterium]|jgi:hypothetical protein|nr:hypothetical protein [Zoogloeaceae bacterium]